MNLSGDDDDVQEKLRDVLEKESLEEVRSFVNKVFGDSFLDQNSVMNLSTFVSEISNSRSPLLLCSTKGFDASSYVTRLATDMKARLTSVSMGSAEGYTMADKSIDKAVSSGNWVMRNVHLCPSWLRKLEKRLYTMSPRDSFRLFLCAEINTSIPANLTRLSHVKIFEAPDGIKASLRRTAISSERMNRAPTERSRLCFLLAWFHAVILERRRFCPVGWTKSYAFGDSDQKCSLDVIDYWIDRCASGKTHVDPSKIPWQAIQSSVGTMYGGRIDNRFDDMVLHSLVKRLFVSESFDLNFELSKDLKAPEGTWYSSVVSLFSRIFSFQINLSYPLFAIIIQIEINSRTSTLEHRYHKGSVHQVGRVTVSNPQWLGLPSSAETRLLNLQARHLISSFTKLQREQEEEEDVKEEDDEEKNDVTSWMRRAVDVAKPWMKKLPTLSPLSRESQGSIDSPVFRCLNREVELGITLLNTVREDLKSVCEAIQDSVKVSNRCRAVMRDLSKNILPTLWSKSTFSLDAWMSDLVRRVDQLSSFSKTSNWSSSSIWLGGLASPEAFLTATRQEAAKSKKCSLQDLHLSLSLSDGDDGFQVQGLDLGGCRLGRQGTCSLRQDFEHASTRSFRLDKNETRSTFRHDRIGNSFLSECKS